MDTEIQKDEPKWVCFTALYTSGAPGLYIDSTALAGIPGLRKAGMETFDQIRMDTFRSPFQVSLK